MNINNHDTICLIHSPDLTRLSYPDELEIRTSFNSELSRHLETIIEKNEKTYPITGHGLLIILKNSNKIRLPSLYQIVNSYEYTWNNHQIDFTCGISYTMGKVDSITASHLFNILSDHFYLPENTYASIVRSIITSMAQWSDFYRARTVNGD